MAERLEDTIRRQAEELEEFLTNDLIDIIEVEGLNHFEASFEDEGFTDQTLEKWQERKTTDSSGRDVTRYRTNRRGKAGSLNAKGRKDKGRAILTGHATGGNKLRNSGRADKINGGVAFVWGKPYAEAHNEGTDELPKRQFAGESAVLNEKFDNEIGDRLNQIHKK